jgi:phage repressor protein C with HTH and peptisase S24 domain
MWLTPILKGTNDNCLREVIVFGNSMLPLYRHGDQLLVSETAPVKTGDRIVVQASKHGTVSGILVHRDQKCVVLNIGGLSKKCCSIDTTDIDFFGRVVWASQ